MGNSQHDATTTMLHSGDGGSQFQGVALQNVERFKGGKGLCKCLDE